MTVFVVKWYISYMFVGWSFHMSVFVTLKQLAGSYLATGYGIVYTVLKISLHILQGIFVWQKRKRRSAMDSFENKCLTDQWLISKKLSYFFIGLNFFYKSGNIFYLTKVEHEREAVGSITVT